MAIFKKYIYIFRINLMATNLYKYKLSWKSLRIINREFILLKNIIKFCNCKIVFFFNFILKFRMCRIHFADNWFSPLIEKNPIGIVYLCTIFAISKTIKISLIQYSGSRAKRPYRYMLQKSMYKCFFNCLHLFLYILLLK